MGQLPPKIHDNTPKLTAYLAQLGIAEVRDETTMLTAFIHKSYANDFTHLDCVHNERMEFLGDSVLGEVIANWLYNKFPEAAESELTLYKISLVREETLAQAARNIKLDQQILLGHGEEKSGGRDKESVTSDAFEALLAYIYIDHGMQRVTEFIIEHLCSLFDQIKKHPVKSYKTLVQEYCQKHYKTIPTYTELEEEKDDKGNVLQFKSIITLQGKEKSFGLGTSKRKAQEAAAETYWTKIEEQ